MAANRRTSAWAIITVAALLLSACNLIAVEADRPTGVPTPFPAPEREPMQASLYDFAVAFAELDSDGIEPKRYADAMFKIRACMEAEPFEGEGAPYTPGQAAAIQWTAIITVIALAAEDPRPDDFSLYDGLIGLQTSCMAEQ